MKKFTEFLEGTKGLDKEGYGGKVELEEARATNIFGLIGEMEKLPSVEKMVDMWTAADGMAGLFRTKDGNSYEITVRQAKLTQHPGLADKTKSKKKR